MLCLIQFWDDWKDFRVPELQQLLVMLRIDSRLLPGAPEGLGGGMVGDVFQYIELPSAEAAQQLCARAVLVKSVYEVWAYGDTFEALEGRLWELQSNKSKEAGSGSVGSGALLPAPAQAMGGAGQPWGHYVEVVPLYKGLSGEQKQRCRDRVAACLDLGPEAVHIKTAEIVVSLVANYETHRQAIASRQYKEEEGATWAPAVPCCLGRLLGRGSMKDELTKYQLKKRLFLGPTSLDHVLSMLMCNLAGVRSGDMVRAAPFSLSLSLSLSVSLSLSLLIANLLLFLPRTLTNCPPSSPATPATPATLATTTTPTTTNTHRSWTPSWARPPCWWRRRT